MHQKVSILFVGQEDFVHQFCARYDIAFHNSTGPPLDEFGNISVGVFAKGADEHVTFGVERTDLEKTSAQFLSIFSVPISVSLGWVQFTPEKTFPFFILYAADLGPLGKNSGEIPIKNRSMVRIFRILLENFDERSVPPCGVGWPNALLPLCLQYPPYNNE